MVGSDFFSACSGCHQTERLVRHDIARDLWSRGTVRPLPGGAAQCPIHRQAFLFRPVLSDTLSAVSADLSWSPSDLVRRVIHFHSSCFCCSRLSVRTTVLAFIQLRPLACLCNDFVCVRSLKHIHWLPRHGQNLPVVSCGAPFLPRVFRSSSFSFAGRVPFLFLSEYSAVRRCESVLVRVSLRPSELRGMSWRLQGIMWTRGSHVEQGERCAAGGKEGEGEREQFCRSVWMWP